MLIACKRAKHSIVEQTIKTIYIDHNQSSHFNPIVDSLKIYFVLFRYMLLSLGTAAIDYLTFMVAQAAGVSVLTSQGCARAVAIFFSYPLAKRYVFFSEVQNTGAFPKFVLLVMVGGTISYGLIHFFMYKFSMNVLPAKMLSELIVYLGNFAVQREFIFFKRYPVQET
jgi:putative flippase GtrA